MIDSILFRNASMSTDYNLNNVVNGVGCALKGFEASIESVRHNQQDVPYSPGLIPTPTTLGRLVVQMEGDVMHNTPTGYWTERLAFAQQFTSIVPVLTLGELKIQMTGQSEVWVLDASLIGPSQIPIGLAGATISNWRLVLGGNDPWFRGQNQQTVQGNPNTNLSLGNFGIGNAPSWPEFLIVGPITNPQILWQGNTILSMSSFTVSSGVTVSIKPRYRYIYSGAGSNLYPFIDAIFGWTPFDPRTVGALGKNVRLNGTGTSGATQLYTYWHNSYTI